MTTVLRPDPHAPLSEVFPIVDHWTGRPTGEYYAVIQHRGAPWQPVRFPSRAAAEEWSADYRAGLVGPATEPDGVDVVHHHHHEEHQLQEDDYLDDEGTDDYPDIQPELGDR